jgi:N-acetylglucosaminyldiphosphoundecaprenol N-acetyl-beta-D-mannosaminyltransferase
MRPPSVQFLRVRFDLLDLAETARQVEARARSDAPFVYVATPNAQAVVRKNAGTDPLADKAWEGAWLSTNDSRVLALLSRWLFGRRLPVAAGSDLTERLFAQHIRPDDPVTIIGGDDALEAALRRRFGLTTIARHVPPFGILHKPDELDRCARFIVDHPAAFVFIVVGTPQSEIIAHKAKELGAGRGVGLCVGSSLNFVTGSVRRAPPLFRRLALEWLYRLMLNPRGHARRVFVQSGPVLWLAALARLNPARHRI